MEMRYVRLAAMAAVMGVTASWLRGLVYQRVMDDERETRAKGSPYVMHVRQALQALVAMRIRGAGGGYDMVRVAVDRLEIDRRAQHVAHLAPGVKLVLVKTVLVREARQLLERANGLEHGYDADVRQAA